MRTRLIPAAFLSAALLAACTDRPAPTAGAPDLPPAAANVASADATSCGERSNNTVDKLLACVNVDGVRVHQSALQQIANANGGTRTSGTPGYDASVQYVRAQLEGAGYDVTVQPFQFQTFIILAPTVVQRVSPNPATIASTTLSYSGSGDVTAPVFVVPNGGCVAADFAGFTAGAIALIRRGDCLFAVKATNAYAAGASAVVFWNNAAGDINATLSNTFTPDLPVVGITQADGLELSMTPGLTMRVRTSTFRGITTSYNVLAETRDGDPDNVVMVGAHLDAVNAGPGIQDNGSGSGAVLETALQMAKVKPRNKVRFAWWGAEENGLVGSAHYVSSLSAAELERITLYLNFDMIASPNYVFFVYDGDDSESAIPSPGPAGSGDIERVFASYYERIGEPYRALNVVASDHASFRAAGVPYGGVFTGASAPKTAMQASIWGGTAGVAYDPCYHQACDTYANVNLHALDVNADAVAYATLTFAMSTEAVNGIRGKGNFRVRPTAAATAHAHVEADR